jgi:hypothetical protein
MEVGVDVSSDDENELRHESKEDNNLQKRMRPRYVETKRIKFTWMVHSPRRY